jgi:hypothetical protein
VGAGVNYTYFYNNGLNAGGQPISITNHSVGPAVQGGVDVQVTKRVFVNADIKKIWMRTDASLGSASLGRLDIDPVVVGLGVGTRFQEKNAGFPGVFYSASDSRKLPSDGQSGRQSLSFLNRIAVPSCSMRTHTARFSSSVRKTQFDTSVAVRPQPLQTSSKRVEQTPMQGLSGRAWRFEAIQNLGTGRRRVSLC